MPDSSPQDFPLDGWLKGASDSYGTDELFRSTPRTMVRIFPADMERYARETHAALIKRGVTTAVIDDITHADGAVWFYVWAERGEMMRLVPEVSPQGSFGRK